MIGSTRMQYALMDALNAPIEEWEDSLTVNGDDYVYVDGEEGDFGITSYFGYDASGNNVRMMVTYNHGGDAQNTYYTQEGIDHIRNVIMANSLNVAFENALMGVLNPADGEDGLKLGAIKALKDADALEAAQNTPVG